MLFDMKVFACLDRMAWYCADGTETSGFAKIGGLYRNIFFFLIKALYLVIYLFVNYLSSWLLVYLVTCLYIKC
jgi:hypothetical protein